MISLYDNIDLPKARVTSATDRKPLFAIEVARNQGHVIWEFEAPSREHTNRIRDDKPGLKLIRSYENKCGILTPIGDRNPPTSSILARVIVGLPRSS